MHPVPQGLTVHAAGFGRRLAVHTIEHQRKRKYPTRRGTILLSARSLAKLRSRKIKPIDRYRRSHRCRSSQKPASSQSFADLGIPNESQFRAVGITPVCKRRKERVTFNHGVEGSSPSALTTIEFDPPQPAVYTSLSTALSLQNNALDVVRDGC